MRFELTSLGTASQSPTRTRGQGGHVLRWEDELVLFDPGEGCQRQLLLAGLSAPLVTRICITHFHGDHCLGLPGLLQSRALATDTTVPLYYPASGQRYLDALLTSSIIDFDLGVELVPLEAGQVVETPRFDLSCAALSHPVPVLGYRLEGPLARHLRPDALAALGVEGAHIGELERDGSVRVGDRSVTLDEVSYEARGPVTAFVMDTAPCAGARSLGAGADLLVTEATFLHTEAELAANRGHMTARQAGSLAAESGVGTLVLTHFSNRYGDVEELEREARVAFARTVAARDLSTVAVHTGPVRH
jgi:ribonuclease Z